MRQVEVGLLAALGEDPLQLGAELLQLLPVGLESVLSSTSKGTGLTSKSTRTCAVALSRSGSRAAAARAPFAALNGSQRSMRFTSEPMYRFSTQLSGKNLQDVRRIRSAEPIIVMFQASSHRSASSRMMSMRRWRRSRWKSNTSASSAACEASARLRVSTSDEADACGQIEPWKHLGFEFALKNCADFHKTPTYLMIEVGGAEEAERRLDEGGRRVEAAEQAAPRQPIVLHPPEQVAHLHGEAFGQLQVSSDRQRAARSTSSRPVHP